MTMKDFFNQELSIGEEVAFMEPEYRSMTLGTILLNLHPKLSLLNILIIMAKS